jgi:tRNA uridine 5-carboxymethylaminomethyl modification enzyme
MKQNAAMRIFKADEQLLLPVDLDYSKIDGISMAEKEALNATKPESIGQARRIEGVTPTAALKLLKYVKDGRKAERRARTIEEEAARKAAYAEVGIADVVA